MKTITSLLIFFSQAHAMAGLTSLSFESIPVPSQIVINPSEVDQYAIWGSFNNSGTEASYSGGLSLFDPNLVSYSNGNTFDPRGPLEPVSWDYLLDGVQTFGGLGFTTADGYPVVGEGFGISLFPGLEGASYEFYIKSYNGESQVTIFDLFGAPVDSISLSPFDYGKLTITASGDPLVATILVTSGNTGVDGANVLIGSGTANIAPVSEPKSVLTALVILPTLMLLRRKTVGPTNCLAT